MTAPLLEVEGLTVRYGSVAAVDGVDLRVGDGEVVGLIGPNGAGKTSLIDAVCGFTPASGSVRLAGERIDDLPAHKRARRGVCRTFQSIELFEDLTVAENVAVGAGDPRWWTPLVDAVRPGGRNADPAVDAALAACDLSGDAHRLPTELSHGRRRTLGLARALARAPRVVLLDEPAAGLDPLETARLGELIRDLPARGTSVLLIDHDMDLVLSVCDRVWVLDFGRVIADGPPAEVRHHPEVLRAYLGTTAPEGGA